MATINEIKQQAEAVKNATQVGENTAMRVGSALSGLADIAKQHDVELAKKFDKESVVQESGNAEDKVMSQKAVSDKLSDLSLNSLLFEQGGIADNGVLVNSSNRIRTSTFISLQGSITLKEPYIIRALYYYSEPDVFVEREEIFKNTAKIGRNGYIYKIVIQEKNNSAISVENVKGNCILESFDNRINTLADEYDKIDNYSKTHSVIDIKVVKVSGIVALLNVGEFGFNTSTNKLIEKTNEDGNYNEYSPSESGGMYIYNNSLCTWNGEKFIPVNVEDKVNNLLINHYLFEQGSIAINGVDVRSDKRIRTTGFYSLITNFCVNEPYIIRGVAYYNKDTGKFSDFEDLMSQSARVGKEDKLYRIVIQKKDDTSFSVNDFKDTTLEFLASKVNTLSIIPPVVFNIDTELLDVSQEVEKMNYAGIENRKTVLEQVYARFDELVASNGAFVSKVDVAELLNINYPEYATLGGNAGSIEHSITLDDGTIHKYTYEATPTYKTYMYKFVDGNSNIGNGTNKKWEKKKILIIGGTHGVEIAAPFNTYLFAKALCESTDVNMDKLRSIFDVYIIPCLNGYGMYHLMRANANYVNINRNYPVKTWVKEGNDSDRVTQYSTQYTGDYAGSEFETQIVMGITNLLKPSMAIDHHNYSSSKTQFYTEVAKEEHLPLTYQSLVDCSYAFRKGLPFYFGKKHKLFKERPGTSPSIIVDTEGKTAVWWNEQGVKFASTIEICEGINYRDGECIIQSGSGELNSFGKDTFAVGEYTLRSQILRYAQWVLNNQQ